MDNTHTGADERPAAGEPAARGAAVRIRRRSRLLLALGAALATVVFAVTSTATGADGRDHRRGEHDLRDPILGSWYAQVHFPGIPFPGKTEATMMTFTPGGGVVEANPINKSPAANSGYWKRNRDGSYHLRLLNFTWDPVTSGTSEVLDIDLTLRLTDRKHFESTEASAYVYYFDSQTGDRKGEPIFVPDVTVTTAEHFDTWKVPEKFPAQPPA